MVLGVAAAVIVSALFYSAFFRHPRGVLDSYLAYATYFGRGAGHDTVHVHPWYYYLQMLLLSRYDQGPIWTEGWIVLLALVGIAAAVKGSRVGPIDPKLVRFLAIYTLAMTVVYSAVPYKTPWCRPQFPARHDSPGRRRRRDAAVMAAKARDAACGRRAADRRRGAPCLRDLPGELRLLRRQSQPVRVRPSDVRDLPGHREGPGVCRPGRGGALRRSADPGDRAGRGLLAAALVLCGTCRWAITPPCRSRARSGR